MSLSTRVDALAARIAVAVKALRDDPRWTDARTPTSHAGSHAANGPDALTPAALGAAADSAVVHNTGTETIGGAKTFSVAPQVPVGSLLTHPVRRDDARLTDARTPTAHAASHAPGQPDALTGYVPSTAVGAASGVASLDSGGKIPQSQVPAIALQEFLGVVASQTAMLALTGQRGDWATRSDTGTDWQLVAEPSTTLASWRERTYPASPVTSVNGRAGAVSGLAEATALALKADAAHVHSAADITSGELATARLPNLLSTTRSASGSGNIATDASLIGNNRDYTATGNVTVLVPTNPTANQVIQYAVLASGGARTITFNASLERLTGIAIGPISIPSGKVCRFSLRYSGLTSTWIVEAFGITQ